MNSTAKPATIDEYIADFPEEIRSVLQQVRETIQQAAPEAAETISYGMPAYKFQGKPLVYFAAFKNHLGFYATPAGHEAFAEELSRYKQGKGSVQFPLNKPMHLDLITRMVEFRIITNLEKAAKKKTG